MQEPGYEYINEDEIDKELICSICLGPVNSPLTHKTCNILYCRECLQRSNWKCPVCRIGSYSDFSIVTVRAIHNMLDRIAVKCIKCKIDSTRGNFETHKKSCTPVSCPAADIGCEEKLDRSKIAEHVRICKYEQARSIIQPFKNRIRELEANGSTRANAKDFFKNKREKGELLVSIAEDRSIRMWDLVSKECIRVMYGHTDEINKIIQVGDSIITASNDSTLRKWNIATGECEVVFNTNGPVSSLTNCDDGAIISGSSNGNTPIQRWTITGTKINNIRPFHGGTICLEGLEEDLFASSGNDKSICIVAGETGRYTHRMRGHTAYIICLCKLGNHLLASGSADHKVRIWNYATGDFIRVLSAHTDNILGLGRVSNNKLVSTSGDGTARIWNLSSRECELVVKLKDRTKPATQLKNNLIVTAGKDPNITGWDLNGRQHFKLSGHTGYIFDLLLLS
jgi:WD40 repeat protein